MSHIDQTAKIKCKHDRVPALRHEVLAHRCGKFSDGRKCNKCDNDDDDSEKWQFSDFEETDANCPPEALEFEFDEIAFFEAQRPLSIESAVSTLIQRWKDYVYQLRLYWANRLLLNLESHENHVKNWRPQLLVLGFDCIREQECIDPTAQTEPSSTEREGSEWHILLSFVDQLMVGGKGYAVALEFIKGHQERVKSAETVARETALDNLIRKLRISGSSSVVIYNQESQLASTVWSTVQAVGFGHLTPNTCLLRYMSLEELDKKGDNIITLMYGIHRLIDLDMSLLIVKGQFPHPISNSISDKKNKKLVLKGTIDMWWILHDGGLILLLSFLLKKHRTFECCELRLFTVAEEGDDCSEIHKQLVNWLQQLRIDASVTVVQFDPEDIAPYVKNREEAVERRRETIISQKHTGKPSKLQPQLIVDHLRSQHLNSNKLSDGGDQQPAASNHIKTDSRTQDVETSPPSIVIVKNDRLKPNTHSMTNETIYSDSQELRTANDSIPSEPTQDIEPYMAAALNKQMVKNSMEAALVIVNLPRPPRDVNKTRRYLQYIDDVTAKLDNCLLVRGTDREVITCFN